MSLFKAVVAACPSRFVNAWRLRSGGKVFVVTPAHVPLHSSRTLSTSESSGLRDVATAEDVTATEDTSADSTPVTGAQLSGFETMLLNEIRGLRKTSHCQGQSMRSLEQSMRSQEQAMRSLEAKVLTISDIDRILNMMATPMVLPWSHMSFLMQDGVDMASLIGKVGQPEC